MKILIPCLVAIVLLGSPISSANSNAADINPSSEVLIYLEAKSRIALASVQLRWARFRLWIADQRYDNAYGESLRAQRYNDAHYSDTTWADRNASERILNARSYQVRRLEHEIQANKATLLLLQARRAVDGCYFLFKN